MHKLYIVGIGPGNYEQMTIRAAEVLKTCDVIVGYTVYIDLIREHFGEKEFLTTPMRQEVKRCEMAFETAMEGKTVAMICSGDAGVYGMSGLLYEMGARYPEVALEVIPGVTAATAGAAVLGAPLMHDFCLISLSDLLTPWEKIERRLRAAAEAKDGCGLQRRQILSFVFTTLRAKREKIICGGPVRFYWSIRVRTLSAELWSILEEPGNRRRFCR